MLVRNIDYCSYHSVILFAEASRTFSLAGRRSVYGMRVDPDDRVVHLGWAPSPDGTDDPALEGTLPEYVLPRAGLDRQGRRDEVLTFGDTTYQEVALKLAFGDVRDVRLRYRSHRIETGREPGGAPTHGLPTQVTSPRETLVLELADPVHPFAVEACYRMTEEHDLIERWLVLENRADAPVHVEQLFFGSLHLSPGPWDLTHGAGGWSACKVIFSARLAPAVTSRSAVSRPAMEMRGASFLSERAYP